MKNVKANPIRISKFEEKGVEFQDNAYTEKEAMRRFSYSCQMCKWRGDCERCKINYAHERALAEIRANDPRRVLLKEQAKLERQKRRVEYLASKGVEINTEVNTREKSTQRLLNRLVKCKCIATSPISHKLGKLGDILWYDPATFSEISEEAMFYERRGDELTPVGKLKIRRFQVI